MKLSDFRAPTQIYILKFTEIWGLVNLGGLFIVTVLMLLKLWL